MGLSPDLLSDIDRCDGLSYASNSNTNPLHLDWVQYAAIRTMAIKGSVMHPTYKFEAEALVMPLHFHRRYQPLSSST